MVRVTDEEREHERALRDAQEKVIAATALLDVRVINARRCGMTWSMIARAIGIARQSATERFERLPELEPEHLQGVT